MKQQVSKHEPELCPCIHALRPELAPLDGRWGHIDEWWQTVAELPLPLQHCFSVQVVEEVQEEGIPLCPQSWAPWGTFYVVPEMGVSSSLCHTQTLHFTVYWFLPGSPCFAKGQICPVVTPDSIWCIVNNKEVNCYLFLTLFSLDTPVARFFALLLALRGKPRKTKGKEQAAF